jgi:hypothetical protein
MPPYEDDALLTAASAEIVMICLSHECGSQDNYPPGNRLDRQMVRAFAGCIDRWRPVSARLTHYAGSEADEGNK